jgi:hypothetical protein
VRAFYERAVFLNDELLGECFIERMFVEEIELIKYFFLEGSLLMSLS